MRVGRLLVVRWLAALVVIALVLTLDVGESLGVPAHAEGDWEQTGLSEPVLQLFTPASGALFAVIASGLLRSDDGGTAWRPVELPRKQDDTRAWRVAVDPLDHSVLYFWGSDGLHRTVDDAASWILLLPSTESARAIAVSPADRDVLYLGLAARPDISADFRFIRSDDGGASWQQLEEHHNTLCGWGVRILEPHPADPNRVFRSAGCYAGRDFSDSLEHSADRGDSWSGVFGASSFGDAQFAFPARLVGGRGTAPGRYFLAANRDVRIGGAALFRSGDDGRAWTEVLSFPRRESPQGPAPNVSTGGLAYDAGAPDLVYVGLNGYDDEVFRRTHTGSWVQASRDGGATWSDLGGRGLAQIADLALGVDGLYLYAATDRGLWRFRSPASTGDDRRQPPVQLPGR